MLSIIVFIIWLIAGVLNLVNCRSDDYQYWRISYWLTYGVLMSILLYNIIF